MHDRPGPRRVAIVGGGASGVLLAVQLARLGPGLAIELVERRDTLGFGLAYSTRDPDHLLNVRNANMSAFDDDPDHFIRWLAADTGEPVDRIDRAGFTPRHTYGRYIQNLLAPLACNARETAGGIVITHGTCADIDVHRTGTNVHLIDGREIPADIVVLATGHDEAPAALPWLSQPWNYDLLQTVEPGAALLIVGSGLSMIDCAISLIRNGHTGPILTLSRRGLSPHTHRATVPVPIDRSEIPAADGPHAVLQWLRRRARTIESHGGTWCDLMDGIRPHAQSIWQSFDPEHRRRFLRHARVFWDIHRHRMAPAIASTIRDARERGQLRVCAGDLRSVEAVSKGYRVSFSRRGCSDEDSIDVARVFNCTGAALNPAQASNALTRRLLAKGLVRNDTVGIGFDVTNDCNLVDRFGVAQSRLYAVGPLTRAAFWEVTAMPDIRVQVTRLAELIAKQHRELSTERPESGPATDLRASYVAGAVKSSSRGRRFY